MSAPLTFLRRPPAPPPTGASAAPPTALAALDNVLRDYRQQGIGLILCGASANVRLKLRRAGIHRRQSRLAYVADLPRAHAKALHWLEESPVLTTP